MSNGKRAAIAAVAWGPNRLDVFGLGTDNQMFHKAWDGSAWRPSPTDWEPLGGRFTSPPTVVAWAPNRLDIFGLGTDRGMYHKWWDGSAWGPSPTDWEPLGGVFNSPPAVTAWGPNRLDVFGLGTDNQMFHKAWDGSAWRPSRTDWEPLGGRFNSAPVAVAWAANRLDIFGLGTDNQMFHKAWTGGTWHPSPTGWEPLGGRFNDFTPQRTYTVRPGDTLSGIARQQLGDANRWPEIFVLNRSIISHRDRISPGQVFALPGPTPMQPRPRLYTVRAGDTLSRIAQRELGNANRWREIATLNRDVIPNPDLIRPGQVLVILPT
jgi:LysM repeat protein